MRLMVLVFWFFACGDKSEDTGSASVEDTATEQGEENGSSEETGSEETGSEDTGSSDTAE